MSFDINKCSACGCDMALVYAGKVDVPRSVKS
jgi:hypothetical protein